jgi:hypothetical protein
MLQLQLRQLILSIYKSLLVILCLVTFLPGIITAQYLQEEKRDSDGLYTYVNNIYGFDHNLVNGIQVYNLYRHVLSHPYFIGEESLPGSVTISGKHFDNQMINYDIHNQWLVLEYKERSGGINKIILEPLHTDDFQIDGNYFEKLILDDNDLLFYQVIRTNGLTCYIHWKKQLMSISNNIKYAEEFSNPLRTYYLENNGIISPFSNRRNFASLFPGTSVKEARKYMRKNNIRFRKVSIENLTGLLEYMSSNHK